MRLHRFIRHVIFCKLFTVCYKFTRLIVGKLTIKLKKQTKDNVGIYATAGVKLSTWIRASPKIHNKSIRLYPPNELKSHEITAKIGRVTGALIKL